MRRRQNKISDQISDDIPPQMNILNSYPLSNIPFQ